MPGQQLSLSFTDSQNTFYSCFTLKNYINNRTKNYDGALESPPSAPGIGGSGGLARLPSGGGGEVVGLGNFLLVGGG